MTDFTEDEIACLKKMVYKFRQDEILELYNKTIYERDSLLITKLMRLKEIEGEIMGDGMYMYRTTVPDAAPGQKPHCEPKSFLVKVKEFFRIQDREWWDK